MPWGHYQESGLSVLSSSNHKAVPSDLTMPQAPGWLRSGRQTHPSDPAACRNIFLQSRTTVLRFARPQLEATVADCFGSTTPHDPCVPKLASHIETELQMKFIDFSADRTLAFHQRPPAGPGTDAIPDKGTTSALDSKNSLRSIKSTAQVVQRRPAPESRRVHS
jgi:hypothetical protein